MTKNIDTNGARGNSDADEKTDVAAKKWNLLKEIAKTPALSASADYAIAILLVNYFNRLKGCAWPSEETLAAETGRSLRSVQYAIARLLAFRIFFRQYRGRGEGRSNEYVPNWDYTAESCGLPLSLPAESCGINPQDSTGKVGVNPPDLASHKPTPPVGISRREGEDPDAGRSPADAARARAGEAAPADDASKRNAVVSDAVNRVWAVWYFKPPGSFKLAKRAIADLLARVDAPAVGDLVRKAAAFAATRRRRWLHMWITEDEGWREDDAQPFAPKEERAPHPAKATGKKKRKAKAERAEPEPEDTYEPAITPEEQAARAKREAEHAAEMARREAERAAAIAKRDAEEKAEAERREKRAAEARAEQQRKVEELREQFPIGTRVRKIIKYHDTDGELITQTEDCEVVAVNFGSVQVRQVGSTIMSTVSDQEVDRGRLVRAVS
jgi:hypothetical protein